MAVAGLAVCAALAGTAVAGQGLAIAGIHAYQHALAPVIGRATGPCRFTPSCSHYAEAVIARDGLARGGWKAVRRIARCGPWTPHGTLDLP